MNKKHDGPLEPGVYLSSKFHPDFAKEEYRYISRV